MTIIGRRYAQPDRSDAAEPQKRRRARPQRIKAGRDKGTTAERAYRLDFGLSRYARRGYSRDGIPPEAGSRHHSNVRNNARGTRRRRQFQPRQRNPVAAAVTGNRSASPGDIADQRHGLNPGHDERHSPRCCITVLSPTAAPQSVPGTSAARRRIKPRTQPAGSIAGRHHGGDRREPTRRSSGIATINPTAATQRNPETPKDKASADQGRQGQGNDGRTRLPPRFRPFSVRPQGLPAGRNSAKKWALLRP